MRRLTRSRASQWRKSSRVAWKAFLFDLGCYLVYFHKKTVVVLQSVGETILIHNRSALLLSDTFYGYRILGYLSCVR